MRFQPPVPAVDPQAVRSAWREFVETGAIDVGRVRAPILRAWQRSSAAGCDAHQARADVLPPAQTIELIRRESRLVEIATPFLAALSRAAGAERHAAMLGDANARVLKVIGDPETMADENFPRAGSLLSEDIAGANGVGTALAERGYVELVGPEHFIEGFHVFTCQGVPLLGFEGVIGVLSMSVRREATAGKVRDILFCASEAAECELLSERLSDTLTTAAPLDRTLELLRQDIVQRIAMARLQFELAARQIAAGTDAAGTLGAAQQLIGKFRRQAAVWRNLVGQGSAAPEPIDLAALADDLINLLATEARVSAVSLAWGRADRVIVLDDRQALAQRLLQIFLDGMQSAAGGGELVVDVAADNGRGTVALTTAPAGRRQHGGAVSAPILR